MKGKKRIATGCKGNLRLVSPRGGKILVAQGEKQRAVDHEKSQRNKKRGEELVSKIDWFSCRGQMYPTYESRKGAGRKTKRGTVGRRD